MLASINPLGERARGNRWGWTVGGYTVAAVAAAAALGGALGALGGLVAHGATWRLPAIGAIALAAGIADLAAPGRLLSPRRQVDEGWLSRYRGWVYGVGFGAQLGVGVVTVVTSATVYAWLAATALSGTPVAGALIGAAFGLARAMPFAAVARVRRPDDLRASLRGLAGWAARGRVAAAGGAVALGAGCIVTRLG
jgi:MFS family permease